jgi:Putative 2OG-Fe(II) oxygenase
MEYQTEYFDNIGVIKSMFDELQLAPIKEEINKIRSNFKNSIPLNYGLAGNLEHEYQLLDCHSHVEKIMLPLVHEFNDHFNYYKSFNILKNAYPIVLEKLWVNFQKKYEFNPIHNHLGLMSFVLWIDTPYDIKDELANPSGINSNSNCPGHFSFIFINSMGQVQTKLIPVDKSYNGKLVLFPAKMYHCVYPFYTSDEYRISVSGNFVLDA